MVNILKLWNDDRYSYRERLSFYAWYLYASRIERLHPMNCGFWSVRRRKERRPNFPQEAIVPFWLNRSKVLALRLWGLIKLFFQLEEVWLRSRPRSKIEEGLFDLIEKTKHGVIDWRDLKGKDLVNCYKRLQIEIPEVRVPSVIQLWLKKKNPFAMAFTRTYTHRIWKQWYLYLWNPFKWIEVWLFELVHGVRFLFHLFYEELEKKPMPYYGLLHKA